MPIFRVTFDELSRLGRIRRRPEKSIISALKENGYIDTMKGRLELVTEKPLSIRYGEILYIVRDYAIDMIISEDLWAQVRIPEKPELFLTGKLAPFIGTMGMGEPTALFRKVSHRYWVDAETLGYKRGTSTFTQFPTFITITIPYRKRVIYYIYFRPRIPTKTAIENLARITGVSEREIRETIETLIIEGVLKEVRYETYPEKFWKLLAVKIVSENEGKFTFTQLREKLREYGLTTREAYSTVYEALREDLIRIEKRRLYTTPKGKAELSKLPSATIKKGLVVTEKGRREL